jgi:outer membrane lipoprotein-sorting protein
MIAPLLILVLGSAGPLPRPAPVTEEPTSFLEGEERTEFLAEVERRMSAVDSVVATFEQDKRLELFEDVVHSTGALLFRRPADLRWEILTPYRSILVVSGDRVGKFEFDGARRRALALGAAEEPVLRFMERIRGWFDGRFEDTGRNFEVNVARTPAPRLVLRPREKDAAEALSSIEVDLASDLAAITQVTLRERGGDFTVMRFTERLRDATLPDALFAPDDPAALDLAALGAPEDG